MQDELKAAAHRCAVLFDQAHPGWAGKTNSETLDMESSDTCVLTQVFGNFKDGLCELHLLDSTKKGIELGNYYGIYVPFEVPREDRPALYAVLTEKWKGLIADRLNS